jgi:hypothetical protein
MAETRKHAVSVRLSATELRWLDGFCEEQGFGSRAAGAQDLLRRGLNAAAQESSFAQAPAASNWVN